MAYQDHIDWAWNSGDACGRPVCLFYKVWDNPPIFRGPLSAHVCVLACIAARSSNVDLAARWLMAAQAHNQGAQDEIWTNKQAAVDYAYQRYGQHHDAAALTSNGGDGAADATASNDFITPPEVIWQHAKGIFSEQKQDVTYADLM